MKFLNSGCLLKQFSMQLQKENILKNYEFITVNGFACNLGFGSYGFVQLAKCLKTKRLVAIKKIRRSICKSQVEIHMNLSHPNIIKLFDFYLDAKKGYTYLILEYAENGNLLDYLHAKTSAPKFNINSIFYSVCDAVNYLHSQNIMHRDIKPQNILFDRNNVVKICDFGFATACQPRSTVCGTPLYMSPEMIEKKIYSYKVDIWSLGILLYQMIEGKTPFTSNSEKEVLTQMKQPINFSKKFHKHHIKIIQSMLKFQPKDRPEIKQILKIYFNPNQRPSQCSTIDSERTRESKIRVIDIKEKIRQEFQQNKFDHIHITSIKSLTSVPSSSLGDIGLKLRKQRNSFKTMEKQKISLRGYGKKSLKQHNI